MCFVPPAGESAAPLRSRAALRRGFLNAILRCSFFWWKCSPTDRLPSSGRCPRDVGFSPNNVQPRHEVAAVDAIGQGARHGVQQLVADGMPKRIVDALEFVDVDVEHRQLLARSDISQLLFQPFAKQGAVGEPAQRVVERLPVGDLMRRV